MNPKFQSILVPVDFSESSHVAIEQAVIMAEASKLNVILLHIIQTSSRLSLFQRQDTANEQYIQSCTSKLQGLADKVKAKSNVKVDIMIEKSKAGKATARIAELFYSKYVVYAFPPKTSEEKKEQLLKVLQIFKDTHADFLALHTTQIYPKFQNILLPLDLTLESRQKVSNAVELAGLYDATIRIVSISTDSAPDKLGKLRQQMEQVYKFIRSHHIKCTATVLDVSSDIDKTVNKLLAHSTEVNADIIIAMGHQEKRQTHTEEILLKAKIPVMIVVAKNISTIMKF